MRVEITCKGKSILQGNPLYLETRVKWMPYSTRARIHIRAFWMNQVYIWNYQNHRENHWNQNNQRGQGKHYQKPSRKPTQTNKTQLLDLCRPRWTWVRTTWIVFVWLSLWFDSFSLGLFGRFVFVGCPYGCWCVQLLHCMFKRLPGHNYITNFMW